MKDKPTKPNGYLLNTKQSPHEWLVKPVYWDNTDDSVYFCDDYEDDSLPYMVEESMTEWKGWGYQFKPMPSEETKVILDYWLYSQEVEV